MISNEEIEQQIRAIHNNSEIDKNIVRLALWELEAKREENKFDEDLLKIANHYKEEQFLKLIEEMSELTQAIIKSSLNEDEPDHINEEIADVEVVLRQLYLQAHPEVRAKINTIKEYKIKRTLERISKGKQMHVYKMNNCDVVVSDLNKEETNAWYEKEIDEENTIEEIKELNIDTDGMFYEVSPQQAKNKRIYPPDEAKIFGRFTVCPSGEICEYISIREALKRDGKQELPYIIASTEI